MDQMANPKHVDVVKRGPAAIAEWRTRNTGVLLDLVNADLRGVSLESCNLQKAALEGVHLTGANLMNANLFEADLKSAELQQTTLAGADLRSANLYRAKMQRSNLRNTRLHSAELRGANLTNAILEGANLTGARLVGADLAGAVVNDANLTSADLSGVTLENMDLRGVTLRSANLKNAKLGGAHLMDTDLRNSQAEKVDLTSAIMRGANLTSAVLHHAVLRRADLTHAQLRHANFTDADLQGAKLDAAEVNSETDFRRANVAGCSIDRYTLECLKEYGGLTTGDRIQMRIRDGVATLRASYSGFLQWIHVAALVLFLFPYATFVVRQWLHARFSRPEDATTLALWQALVRFIWNGGENWQIGWQLALLPFLMFVYSLLYNMLRGLLLWKTKKLELKQEASGLPVIFSLTGFWGWVYWLAELGFYANLIAVLVHTWHFMCQRVPV